MKMVLLQKKQNNKQALFRLQMGKVPFLLPLDMDFLRC